MKLISSLDSSTMATGLCVLGRASSFSSLPNSRKPRADPFFLSIVTANIMSMAGRASSVSWAREWVDIIWWLIASWQMTVLKHENHPWRWLRRLRIGCWMTTWFGLLTFFSTLEPKWHLLVNVLKHTEGSGGGKRGRGREERERERKGEREERKSVREGGREQRRKALWRAGSKNPMCQHSDCRGSWHFMHVVQTHI